MSESLLPEIHLPESPSPGGEESQVREPGIRVLLVDDHAILREGLRALLGYYEDIRIVGEARDGAEALVRVGELRPDLVLMDIAMPGMNGIDATGLIHEAFPQTRVLILTQHEDWQYVRPLLQATRLLPRRP